MILDACWDGSCWHFIGLEDGLLWRDAVVTIPPFSVVLISDLAASVLLFSNGHTGNIRSQVSFGLSRALVGCL